MLAFITLFPSARREPSALNAVATAVGVAARLLLAVIVIAIAVTGLHIAASASHDGPVERVASVPAGGGGMEP